MVRLASLLIRLLCISYLISCDSGAPLDDDDSPSDDGFGAVGKSNCANYDKALEGVNFNIVKGFQNPRCIQKDYASGHYYAYFVEKGGKKALVSDIFALNTLSQNCDQTNCGALKKRGHGRIPRMSCPIEDGCFIEEWGYGKKAKYVFVPEFEDGRIAFQGEYGLPYLDSVEGFQMHFLGWKPNLKKHCHKNITLEFRTKGEYEFVLSCERKDWVYRLGVGLGSTSPAVFSGSKKSEGGRLDFSDRVYDEDFSAYWECLDEAENLGLPHDSDPAFSIRVKPVSNGSAFVWYQKGSIYSDSTDAALGSDLYLYDFSASGCKFGGERKVIPKDFCLGPSEVGTCAIRSAFEGHGDYLLIVDATKSIVAVGARARKGSWWHFSLHLFEMDSDVRLPTIEKGDIAHVCHDEEAGVGISYRAEDQMFAMSCGHHGGYDAEFYYEMNHGEWVGFDYRYSEGGVSSCSTDYDHCRVGGGPGRWGS